MSEQSEEYGPGWIRGELIWNPKTGEVHALSGGNEQGGYPLLDYVNGLKWALESRDLHLGGFKWCTEPVQECDSLEDGVAIIRKLKTLKFHPVVETLVVFQKLED